MSPVIHHSKTQTSWLGFGSSLKGGIEGEGREGGGSFLTWILPIRNGEWPRPLPLRSFSFLSMHSKHLCIERIARSSAAEFSEHKLIKQPQGENWTWVMFRAKVLCIALSYRVQMDVIYNSLPMAACCWTFLNNGTCCECCSLIRMIFSPLFIKLNQIYLCGRFHVQNLYLAGTNRFTSWSAVLPRQI